MGATQPATQLDSSLSSAPPTGQDVRVDRAEVRPRLDLSLPHVDGFDGIRGVFLVVILLGHHGWHRIPGALFTVSMFFTLSGYLIATLMLAEWGRTGRVSLARFWERRARRLLPAAFAAVAFVAVLEWWFGVGGGPRFRGDLLSALGYVANWRMASSGTDYAANFLMESPVQHFWSLAIEEQFYLTFPLLFVGVLWLTRQRWGAVGVVCGVLAVASFVAAWVSSARHGNVGITYYATYAGERDPRCVTLAFVLAPGRPAVPGQRPGRAARRVGRRRGGGRLRVAHHQRRAGPPFTFRGGTILNAVHRADRRGVHQPRPGLVVRGLCLAPFRYLGMATTGSTCSTCPSTCSSTGAHRARVLAALRRAGRRDGGARPDLLPPPRVAVPVPPADATPAARARAGRAGRPRRPGRAGGAGVHRPHGRPGGGRRAGPPAGARRGRADRRRRARRPRPAGGGLDHLDDVRRPRGVEPRPPRRPGARRRPLRRGLPVGRARARAVPRPDRGALRELPAPAPRAAEHARGRGLRRRRRHPGREGPQRPPGGGRLAPPRRPRLRRVAAPPDPGAGRRRGHRGRPRVLVRGGARAHKRPNDPTSDWRDHPTTTPPGSTA